MGGQGRDVSKLTEAELDPFIAYWHEQGEGYRQQRRGLTAGHPDAYRLGNSGWWCSKQESMGLQEARRRRLERRRGEAQMHVK